MVADRARTYTERLPLGWAAGCTACPWRFEPKNRADGWPMPWLAAVGAALWHLVRGCDG